MFGKEKIKLIIWGWHAVYIENPKESIYKLLVNKWG